MIDITGEPGLDGGLVQPEFGKRIDPRRALAVIVHVQMAQHRLARGIGEADIEPVVQRRDCLDRFCRQFFKMDVGDVLVPAITRAPVDIGHAANCPCPTSAGSLPQSE